MLAGGAEAALAAGTLELAREHGGDVVAAATLLLRVVRALAEGVVAHEHGVEDAAYGVDIGRSVIVAAAPQRVLLAAQLLWRKVDGGALRVLALAHAERCTAAEVDELALHV